MTDTQLLTLALQKLAAPAVIGFLLCSLLAGQTYPRFYKASLEIGPGDPNTVRLRAWFTVMGGEEFEMKPANPHIEYSFNAAHDLVWVSCKKGFTTTSATADKLQHEIIDRFGMRLDPTRRNRIVIDCVIDEVADRLQEQKDEVPRLRRKP
jgi:hypothetical protein